MACRNLKLRIWAALARAAGIRCSAAHSLLSLMRCPAHLATQSSAVRSTRATPDFAVMPILGQFWAPTGNPFPGLLQDSGVCTRAEFFLGPAVAGSVAHMADQCMMWFAACRLNSDG